MITQPPETANKHLSSEEKRHPLHESREIAKVAPMHYGHMHLTFTDGSMDVIRREELHGRTLKAGEFWPPKIEAATPARAPELDVPKTELPAAPIVTEPEPEPEPKTRKKDALDAPPSEKAPE
jgi:hypothetical protein